MGVVNYQRDMWARRLHKLASLNNITFSKVKFKWNKIKQGDFDEIKRILVRDTLLPYLDFNEEF